MSMLSPYSATPGQVAGVMDSIAATDPRFASTSPALALDAAQSADPSSTATTLAHADAITNAQDAVQQQQQDNGGVFGWLHQHVMNPLGTGLQWLGKPLQEIQKDYRFLHAVYTQYGAGAGVLATLGVAGGVVGGLALGQPVAGAALALEGERQFLGRTMWQKAYALSDNPDYQVSFGRDLANLVVRHQSGVGGAVSGAADAIFDFALDPLAIAGRASQALKAGNVLGKINSGERVPIAAAFPGVQRWLQASSLRAYSPDQVDAVFHGNTIAGQQYRRALGSMVGKSEGEIAVAYPQLAPVATRIADAADESGIEGAHQVIRDAMFHGDAVNSINGAAVLPSRSLAGSTIAQARDAVTRWGDGPKSTQANWLIPKSTPDGVTLPVWLNPTNLPSAAAKTIRTWTGRKPFVITPGLDAINAKQFALNDPAAYKGIYDMFRFGMGDRMAKEHLTAYIQAVDPVTGAADLATRRALINSGMLETLKAMGLPDDPQLLADVRDALHKGANGWSMGSAHRAYGYGHDLGDDVSKVDTESGSSPVALHPWQDDKTATFLDFYAARRAIRDMHQVTRQIGGLDDGLRKNFTEAIFKPMALLTGGFAMRIAAGEVLQTMMRFGTLSTARAIVQSAGLHLGMKLDADTTENVLSAMHEPLMAGDVNLPAPTPAQIRAVHAHAQAGAPDIDPVTGVEPETLGPANEYGNTFMSKIALGAVKVAGTASPERMDLAAKMILRGDGHIGTGAMLTGHGSGYGDVDASGITNHVVWTQGSRFAKQRGQDYWKGKLAWKPSSNNFGVYEPESIKFPLYWKSAADHASQDLQSRNIIRDVLDRRAAGAGDDEAWQYAAERDAARIQGRVHDPSEPDGLGAQLPAGEDQYAAWRRDMTRTVAEDPRTHAYKVADDLRNTVTGKDGTFHQDVAESIVNGDKLPINHYVSKDPLTRPKGVAGPEWEPYTGGNLLKRFVEAGYTKAIDPIINHLSRNPLMLLATERELKSLQWAIDNGTMDSERALSIAMHRATHAILPQIHNTALRSQFALATANIIPFWFAQEQAYRRASRLIAENPASLRYYQMIENGMTSSVQTKNGNVTLPFVGAWGQHAVAALSALGVPIQSGLPIDATGNLQSLKTVLPEANLPGSSPVVAVAANELSNFAPGLTPALTALVGSTGIHQSLIDQLIPNSPARTFLKGLTLPEGDNAVHSEVLNALAAAYYHGQFPPADATGAERQAFMDRIYNNVRSALMLKAVLGVVSPISPQVTVSDPGFRQEFSDLVSKTGDYAKALDEFTAKHGDKVISYTIGQSAPTGAKIPESSQALAWIDANQALVRGTYGTGAAFLVPTGSSTGDARTITDQLLKMGLREQRTPEQFMDAIYVGAGNNLLNDPIRVHQANLAKYANDSTALAQENQAWSQFVQKQRMANPLWYDNYTSDSRRTLALQAVSDLFNIFQKGLVDETDSHVAGVKGLLTDFVRHSQAQAQLHAGGAAGSIGAERTQWTQYLDSLAGYTDPATGQQIPGSKPELATIIRTVFLPLAAQNIDLSQLGA